MISDKGSTVSTLGRFRRLWIIIGVSTCTLLVVAALFERHGTREYAKATLHALSSHITSKQRQEPALIIDTFQNFTKAEACNVSTAQLHHGFEPYCDAKEDVLDAMTGGGRHGYNQPYATLGCSMRWFTTAQICDVMRRFDRITFVGDSLMRQLMIAMHIFLREDLVSGARQTWLDDNPEDQDCHCRTLFSKGSKCFWWEAINTDAIWKRDPASMKCPPDTGRFSFFFLPYWPIKEDDVDFFVRETILKMPANSSKTAYVFGQGAWSIYNATQTKAWIEQLEEGLRTRLPSYFTAARLFITPSANHWNKPDEYALGGNNIYVVRHARAMDPYLRQKGFDRLGTYNLTVQSDSPDGTHASLEAALIEAMMVLNWMSMA